MFFMHFHKSCTRNSDNLILLLKTGNADEEGTLLPTINITFKKYEEEWDREVEAELKMIVAANWSLISQSRSKLFSR